MIGTLVNVAGILLGGLIGLIRPKALSPVNEQFFKVMLGAFTVFYGLRLTWISLNGPLAAILKQLLVVVVSLMIGKAVGRLLRLQAMSNDLGRFARDRINAARPGDPAQASTGFEICSALFCAAPLGILGAIQDGLSSYPYPLLVKAVMEGLATMGFARLFGWGALLSALPVLAVQGSISMSCAQYLKPFLEQYALVDSMNATGGLLVFSVALVILELKRLELADYLPSLFVAPLLTYLLGWL